MKKLSVLPSSYARMLIELQKTLSPSSESYELIYDPFEGLFSDEENIFDNSDEERADYYPASNAWTDLEEEPSDSDK